MIKDLRTRPSESDHGSNLAEAQAAWDADNNSYISKRKAEYPAIEDQLDEIYHNGIDSWKAKIKAIKDKYPKS